MYTIEIYYNGTWHLYDATKHYSEAAPMAKALSESMGNDPSILITINPHESNELDRINWRNDAATEKYINEHRVELHCETCLAPHQLAEACTYCQNCYNPFAKELSHRAGMQLQYDCAQGSKEVFEITRAAAAYFGISFR